MNIEKEKLLKYYFKENKSISDIAKISGKSENAINYWMKKYGLKKRSISEAIYLKNNPNGDSFKVSKPSSLRMAELKGFGLGLYWGEGNKKNKNSIKLANTDASLINKFIEFLVEILGVDKNDIKFSLQVFNDVDPEEARAYWVDRLSIETSQFYKTVTVTKSNKLGTCKEKNMHGVVNIYYHNTKLKNILMEMLPL